LPKSASLIVARQDVFYGSFSTIALLSQLWKKLWKSGYITDAAPQLQVAQENGEPAWQYFFVQFAPKRGVDIL
jgi:hypothetical protein